MAGAVCPKCWNSTNDATMPRCDKDDCPGKPKYLSHFMPKAETCAHEWGGWREFDDGRGGEQVCKKCGLGAMAHTLSQDW